jgi:signal recognition particle subunit SRP54
VFDSLSDRLTAVFRRFSGHGRLSKEDVETGLREVRVALLEADVNFRVARAFVDRIRERAVGAEVLESLTPGQQIVTIVNEELTALLGGETRRIRYQAHPPTVLMLMGLQGSGKTTSAAKLALAIRREGHRPLLVAADLQRPAAVQQLEKLGRDNNIPVALPHETKDVPAVVRRGVTEAGRLNCDVIIIDTAGRLQIDEPLLDELRRIRKNVDVHETMLVVDAMTGQEAVNVAKTFADAVGVDGVLLTKLDGDARGGAALSLREVTGVPIKYVGVGEKLDALELFHPDRLAQRILGMGDVLSLIERAQEHVDQEQAARMQSKVVKGEFDLQDFLEQMAQLRKMAGGGGLTGLVEMLPGVGRALKEARQAGQQIDEKQFKRIEAIIQSMTMDERRRPEIIGGSRKKRIARGSGTNAAEINQLLKQFNDMRTLMKQLGRGGLPGLGGPAGFPGLGGGMPVPATAGNGTARPVAHHHGSGRKKKKRR